jgi:hypothetical protein
VIVTLDADGDRDSVTGVDDSRVLSRSDEYVRARCRESAQMQSRRLVRAVFGPHHAKERQFKVIGFATEDSFDLFELIVAQPEGSVETRGCIHANKLPGAHGYSCATS